MQRKNRNGNSSPVQLPRKDPEGSDAHRVLLIGRETGCNDRYVPI